MLFIPKERWICQLILCWGYRGGHCAGDARGCPVTCVTHGTLAAPISSHAFALGWLHTLYALSPVQTLPGGMLAAPLHGCCRVAAPRLTPGLVPSQQSLNSDAVGVQGWSLALWHHISSLWVAVLEELQAGHGGLEKL